MTTQVHPLLLFPPDPRTTWEDFLLMWKESKTFIQRLGLLHSGFKLDTPVHDAVICFYLEIADGYRSLYTLERRGEREIRESCESAAFKRRRDLARKALKELCDNFFSDPKRQNINGWNTDEPSWMKWLVCGSSVFEKLIWFFRPYDDRGNDGRSNIPDADDDSSEGKVLRKFLHDFFEFTWSFNPSVRGSDRYRDYGFSRERLTAAEEMFMKARPGLLEIMDVTRSLGMLLERNPYQPSFEVDAASMEKLKELAFIKDGRFNRVEKYESIAEAILCGNRAARVYVPLEMAQAEARRRKEIAEAEEALRAAQQNVDRIRTGQAGI